MYLSNNLANYTITIFQLLESGYDFGLDKYTIFDENYREVLNKAILDYYMFREIAFLEPEKFKFKLNSRLDMLMRNKYNRLYIAKQKEFNPLYNIEITENFTHEVENTGINNSNATNSNTNKSTNTSNSTNVNNSNSNSENKTDTENKDTNKTDSDAIQSNVINPTDEFINSDGYDKTYVDSAVKNKTSNSENNQSNFNSTSTDKTDSNSTDTMNTNGNIEENGNSSSNVKSDSNNKTIESYIKKTEGSSAGLPFSRAMLQLKEYFDAYQLDQLIIDELSDLFMQIW